MKDRLDVQRKKAAKANPGMAAATKGRSNMGKEMAPPMEGRPFKDGGKVENPHKMRRKDTDVQEGKKGFPRHLAAGGAAKARKGAC